MVIVKIYGQQTWTIPYGLLVNVSTFARNIIGDSGVLNLPRSIYSPYVEELFFEWLFTGLYHEDGSTSLVPGSPEIVEWGHEFDPTENNGPHTMPCYAKAALYAWNLGNYLEAPEFQNYAMRRLFCAYSSPHINPMSPKILNCVEIYPTNYGIKRFFQDYVLRNWGDDSKIHHDDEVWSTILGNDSEFRKIFLQTTSKPLQERRKEPMNLDDYLIKT